MRSGSWDGRMVGCVALSVALSASVFAQEEEVVVNAGDVSVSAGFDVASAYYYRGIPQEDQGVVTQPYAELGFSLFESDDGPLNSLGIAFGTWNSLHSNTSNNPWYESDFYASIAAGFGPVEASFGYTYLYGPNAGGFFSEEIAAGLALDDTAITGLDFGLNPSATIIWEVDGGSDGLGDSGNEGTLLELALEPSFEIPATDDLSIGISVPMVWGINLGDYYETGSGTDDDQTFGYFDIAPTVSIPLTFVPATWGTWGFSASVHFLLLGDSASEIGQNDFGVSDGDDFETYVSGGISIDY